jgi:hypothetical protein
VQAKLDRAALADPENVSAAVASHAKELMAELAAPKKSAAIPLASAANEEHAAEPVPVNSSAPELEQANGLSAEFPVPVKASAATPLAANADIAADAEPSKVTVPLAVQANGEIAASALPVNPDAAVSAAMMGARCERKNGRRKT